MVAAKGKEYDKVPVQFHLQRLFSIQNQHEMPKKCKQKLARGTTKALHLLQCKNIEGSF